MAKLSRDVFCNIYDNLGKVRCCLLHIVYDRKQNLGVNLHDPKHFRESLYY